MVLGRIFLFALIMFIQGNVIGQTFSVDTAIEEYELLVTKGEMKEAVKLGYKIGEYYQNKRAYQDAIKYFEKAVANATQVSDVIIQSRGTYQKGLSEKLLAESGRLSMVEEQEYYKACIESFKRAHVLFSNAKRSGSREDLYSLLYGGEALFIVGNYSESVGPLKTVLRYSQKNRDSGMILKSSDLLAKNYQQMNDALNQEYYQSIYDSYFELNMSKDSLVRAKDQLRVSTDSLQRSHHKLKVSKDSIERIRKSLMLTEQSLNESKDSLIRSQESLRRSEASLRKSQQSLEISKDSLMRSLQEIAVLDSANMEQRTALEIRQAEIIKKQSEIIQQQTQISEKEQEIKKKVEDINQKNQEIEHKEKTINSIKGDLSETSENLKIMMGVVAAVGLLLFLAMLAYQFKRRTNKKLEENNRQILQQKELLEKRQKELSEEKSKTEALLLNILPGPVAEELRNSNKVTPRYYKQVTIMFTDFKGFTSIAETMSPGEIVRELDACFMAFDQIIDRYEEKVGRKCIEKIKTIGDGYMCAGGVPIANESNPLDVVRVGLAMNEYMYKRKMEKISRNEPFFEIRIGINTGPVVAGVVGKRKFAYDIWGDAVNLASRMESSGEVGRVNISGETYRYIKDKYFFTHRGKIQAKNKGEVDMYFVDGRVKYAVKPTGDVNARK